jgi:hypothetical protein
LSFSRVFCSRRTLDESAYGILPIIVRRLLPGELALWWRDDLLLPMLAAIPLAVLALGMAFAHMARWTVFSSVAAVGAVSLSPPP